MLARPRLLSLAVLAAMPLATSACPKSSPPSVPAWDDGGASNDGVMAAHDPAPTDDVVPPDAAADPAAPPVDPDASADATAPPASTDPTLAAVPAPVADPAPVEPAPPAAAPELALPKVKHTKIDDSCGKDAGLGQKLKTFDLKSVDGKATSNKSFRGKVMLVNFWGTWCKPCLKELPEFEQLYRRYKKHGLTLVAIATDEDPAPVKEFVDKRKLAAKVVGAGEKWVTELSDGELRDLFGLSRDAVVGADGSDESDDDGSAGAARGRRRASKPEARP